MEVGGHVWRLRGIEDRLDVHDSEIEVVIVHIADIDADLSHELGRKRRPVRPQIRSEVIPAVAHVVRDVAIDVAGLLVPQRRRVAIRSYRSVHGLPDLQLLRRPAVARFHVLEPAQLPHCLDWLTRDTAREVVLGVQPFAHRREQRRVTHDEAVRVGVRVDLTVVMEVDGVRILGPRSSEEVGVIELQRKRFPPSRRPAAQHSRVRLCNDAKV